MNSKEALEFINSLLREKSQPVLDESEEAIFVGIWDKKEYRNIAAKIILTDQHTRKLGADLCKKITKDLEIPVRKRNFRKPIEDRYKEWLTQQNHGLKSDASTLEMTSPPAPLLPGEGSNCLTAGQPYLVQLVGFQLVRRYNDFVFEQGHSRDPVFTVDDVEAVINDPEFYQRGRYYFDGVWGQAARGVAGQQAILKVLAPHPDGLTIEQLRIRLAELFRESGLAPLEEKQLEEALETLKRHDVIQQKGEACQIIVELFRRWVLNQ